MSELKVNSIKGVGASTAAITVNNSDGTCTANISSVSGGQLGNRNMIINGAMQISQRGTTFAAAQHTAYQLDRYKFVNGTSAGVFTVSQSTTSPDGFSKSWKIVPTTADTPSGNETVRFMQVIEGHNLQSLAKGTSGAKKSVLSFYVKTNKNGVYSVFLYDADNNRQFNGIYTVSNSNWNRYTIDVPADTSGPYGDDNGGSLEIIFHLAQSGRNDGASLPTTWISYGGNGSEARGHTATFADSTSNEFYITGIQYEVNESGVATDFEHRSFGQELALCQRYYYKHCEGTDKDICSGGYYRADLSLGSVHFPVTMRTAPALDHTTGTNYYRTYSNNTYDDFNNFQIVSSGINSAALDSLTGTSGTIGHAGRIATASNSAAYVAFNAEL